MDNVEFQESESISKGSIAELEDLIEDIHCRFSLQDVIVAMQKYVKFRLRNIHLKPEFRKELEKYLAGLAAGESE